MQFAETSQVLAAQQFRYAVKQFRSDKKIPQETWAAIQESLVLTPSSYGLQPWKFIVVTDTAIKKSLRPHTWNQSQTEDCSHYIVFCALEKMDQQWIDKLMERTATVRSVPKASLAGYAKVIASDLCGARKEMAFEVNARQCYIALGNLMTTAAMLGVDSCPMEGFFPQQYDKILQLAGTGWKSVVCCALGYRNESDKYATAKKVRFPANEVIDIR